MEENLKIYNISIFGKCGFANPDVTRLFNSFSEAANVKRGH